MAQITDLNVSPYYDDFDEADNFIGYSLDQVSYPNKRVNSTTIYTSKSSGETW